MMMRQQSKFRVAVIIILLQPSSTSMFSGNTVNALRRNAVVCFYVITIRKFASASYQGAADVVQYHQTTLSSFLSSFPLPTDYGICSTVCFILQLNLMFIICFIVSSASGLNYLGQTFRHLGQLFNILVSPNVNILVKNDLI